MTNDPQTKIHKFEQAGLGLAPFRFVGFEHKTWQACPGAPIQPGTCCDYCYEGISNVFWIQGADGKRFKVGSTCVGRVGDRELANAVKTEERRQNNANRKAREEKRIAAAAEQLANREVQATLGTQPHPNQFRAETGATLLDWCEWMMEYAGNAGKLRAAKIIEGAAARRDG